MAAIKRQKLGASEELALMAPLIARQTIRENKGGTEGDVKSAVRRVVYGAIDSTRSEEEKHSLFAEAFQIAMSSLRRQKDDFAESRPGEFVEVCDDKTKKKAAPESCGSVAAVDPKDSSAVALQVARAGAGCLVWLIPTPRQEKRPASVGGSFRRNTPVSIENSGSIVCDEAAAAECRGFSAELAAVRLPKTIASISEAVGSTFKDASKSIVASCFC